MQKRNVLNSPRLEELKRHRRKVFLNKILIFFGGLVAMLILAVYLSGLKALKISDINISGNKVVDPEAIKTDIEQSIAGKYIWLFPKDNIIYYSSSSIKNNLQVKFKRLDKISLTISKNKSLQVSVSEREPKYTWCGPDPTANPQTCYFMDENGYIFDVAPYFSGSVYFKFYGSGDLGSYFSATKFQQLVSFKEVLTKMGLKLTELDIADNGEVDIFLTSSSGPKIIFNIDADFQNLAENLQAALTTEPLQTEFKTKYAKLQYIDLRFGNKVYYKFSN